MMISVRSFVTEVCKG